MPDQANHCSATASTGRVKSTPSHDAAPNLVQCTSHQQVGRPSCVQLTHPWIGRKGPHQQLTLKPPQRGCACPSLHSAACSACAFPTAATTLRHRPAHKSAAVLGRMSNLLPSLGNALHTIQPGHLMWECALADKPMLITWDAILLSH